MRRESECATGSQITMEYSFNFDDGFLGTDQNIKQFYVEVYYPAPAP